MLHIGTHFMLRPGNMGRSWMQLGDGSRLRLQELVTLSACQTDVGGGGEVEGLSALILDLGAQAVVASLWQVDDRSTGALMRDLYRELDAGAEPAVALRGAQLRALADRRTERAHPSHWAGFVLSLRAP
ncbi:MAG: CHAT domain-containing protein [Rubrivivax sp.]